MTTAAIAISQDSPVDLQAKRYCH